MVALHPLAPLRQISGVGPGIILITRQSPKDLHPGNLHRVLGWRSIVPSLRQLAGETEGINEPLLNRAPGKEELRSGQVDILIVNNNGL